MKTVILQLGRAGDIIQVLPLAKKLAEAGERPSFAVSIAYKSVLDSVSYVYPEIYDGPFENVLAAREKYSRSHTVIQTQIYGHSFFIPRPQALSFCEESYAYAGFHKEFCNGDFEHIVLDRRYKEDEDELVKRVLGDDKRPLILLNTKGMSSPFPFTSQLTDAIFGKFFDQCAMIDLAKVQANRLGDIMALYERAAFLVTTDTATLHLAGAVQSLPYVAFIVETPSPWHGSYTRGNCLLRIRYGQFHTHLFSLLLLMERTIFPVQYPLRLVHAYHQPPLIDQNTWRRNKVAEGTWRAAKKLGWITSVPLRLEDLPRRFRDGDRDMAFVKDLIDAAAARCIPGRNDAIMLCNSDTCFSMSMYPIIVKAFEDGCVGFYGPRRDFQRLSEPLHPNEIPKGADYPGTDLFVFRPEWWAKHRDQFPDMVLGGEAWDCVLREQMKKQGMPCIKDLIYHERHISRWETPQNRFILPMQRHNLKLACEALQKLEIGWRPGMFGVVPPPF